jgi:hypothetical protein
MARPKKKEENEVIKASAAIQIEGKITLLQRRAWNVLLARAYDELPHKERHAVRVPDLMRDLAYNSGDQEYLKDALEALVGCKLKWNILDKDGHTEWGVAALLAGAKISRGICVYEYGPTLREKLYNPHMPVCPCWCKTVLKANMLSPFGNSALITLGQNATAAKPRG